MSIRDMVARHSKFIETKDFIPTTPYATRALFEYVAPHMRDTDRIRDIWDPACGMGHMCEVFKEYNFERVMGSDIEDYGYTGVQYPDPSVIDFKKENSLTADAIVTNPPYALMEDFIRNGLSKSNTDFAILTRIQVLEGQTRYNKFYNVVPPTKVAVFSDRIPFKTGEVVRKASKMFTHCWMYWDIKALREKGFNDKTELMWLPPDLQSKLEKDGDYD